MHDRCTVDCQRIADHEIDHQIENRSKLSKSSYAQAAGKKRYIPPTAK